MTTLILIFLIAALGYALGRIRICGIGLGSSGVLIIALVFGHFGYELPSIIRELGLVFFVTSVGFIAGPVFFQNFKNHAMAFIVMGFSTILLGSAMTILVMKLWDLPVSLSVGMMAGSLTSTPGLAAALESTGDTMASIGYGIAYPFGVVSIVLFVQLIPKLLRADIPAEVAKITIPPRTSVSASRAVKLDKFGLSAFALAVVLGLLVAKITIPLPSGGRFSLGTSGGPLLVGVLLGHLGHVGPISLEVDKSALNVLRELGLILFLMGAGIGAGAGFVETLGQYGYKLFFLGMLIKLIPMLLAYFIARKLLKMSMFNALGSICGGMTSTPALGTLMTVAGSDSVTTPYAATYPVALICIILSCQFISILF